GEGQQSLLSTMRTAVLLAFLAGVWSSSCDVEAEEDEMIEAMRQELLQRGMKYLKDTPRSSIAPAAPAMLEDEVQEQNLAQDLNAASTQSMQWLVNRRALALIGPTWDGQGSSVDCQAHPMFCHEKVKCQEPLSDAEKQSMDKHIAPGGKANLRSWCRAYPMYSITMQKCIVEEDPHSYAQEMFQYQQKLKLVGADAIYCFVAGHCNNTEVTERTTMSEAEQVCNKRYGSRWTEVGWTDFMAVLARALELGTTHQIPKEWKVTGWGSLVKLARREADISAMTACAMGNFQCDVAYCKMNYCDSPKFRAKFGNLSWSYD
ncbi:unnamed protein product, partial [Effrenium voratum]